MNFEDKPTVNFYVYYVSGCSSKLRQFTTFKQMDAFCEKFVETEDSWLEFSFSSDNPVKPLSDHAANYFELHKRKKK